MPPAIVESLIETLVWRLLVVQPVPANPKNMSRPEAKQAGHNSDDVLTLAASTFTLLVDLPSFRLPSDTTVRHLSVSSDMYTSTCTRTYCTVSTYTYFST